MKNSIKFTLVLIVFFSQLNLFSQSNSIEYKANTLVKIIQKHHYSPRPVDEKFSELAIDELIKNIDPYKIILTKSDIDSLKSYRSELYGLILNKKDSFVNVTTNIYQQRILYTDSILSALKSTKLNYNKNDTIILKTDNKYLTKKELSEFILGLVKYYSLNSYYSWKSVSDSTLSREEILEKEKNKIIDNFRKAIVSDDEGTDIREYIEIAYLKSIATAFDPHTVYFPPQEEEEFSNMLSKKIFAFGIELHKNDLEKVEITEIIPGSPAWISGQINEGDIVLSIKTSKNKINILEEMTPDEINKLISEVEDEEVNFHILKKNNKEIDVLLTKEAIDNDENAIDSYILEGEKKIGYINLPSFYVERGDLNYTVNGSASDMAKSIIRLKEDNIDGLIINLNYNGGGSILEAINMAGIFIDFGAVAIAKQRGEDPQSLRDMNRGTIYDGPLVVLMNTFSASASEFFAAALQDYNRAVIVGSQSFGKATAQEVIPIDTRNNYKTHDAFLKLTTAEIFRVDGTSNQKRGVIPDIVLPDYFNHDNYSERNYKSALDNTTVDKETYFKALDTLPVNYLKSLSSQRIKVDSSFILIEKNNAKYSDKMEFKIPLELNEFEAYFNLQEKERENEIFSDNNIYEIKKPSSLVDLNQLQNPDNEFEENKRNSIKKDIYIKEAYNILNDWINLINK